MAFSGHSVQAGATKADGLLLLPYPDPYRPYRDDPTGGAILDQLRQHLDAAPERFAAAFIEPIQADGGLIVPPPGFFRAFAEICREFGVLVVCDSVNRRIPSAACRRPTPLAFIPPIGADSDEMADR